MKSTLIALLSILLISSCKDEIDNIEPVIIETAEITDITYNSAQSGGIILNKTNVSEKGICWDTLTSPTIDDNNKTEEGTGYANFESELTGLIENTVYYVRAYAINEEGISYGEERNFKTEIKDTFAIGSHFQGGIIGYVFQPEDIGYVEGETHGLIVAPYDQSSTAEWGCLNTEMAGQFSTTIGSGLQNTIDIVNGCSEQGIAAKLCYDLVIDEYDDWFLPSKDELNKLCQNRFEINSFESNFYWSSSSEGSTSHAWSQSFGSSSQYFEYKHLSYYVRAVRKF